MFFPCCSCQPLPHRMKYQRLAAGVLIFTEIDGVQYVLLADRKGWSKNVGGEFWPELSKAAKAS